MKKVCVTIIFAIIISVSMFVQANSNELVKLNLQKDDDEIKIVLKTNDISDDGILGLQGSLSYNKENLELIDKKVLVDDFNITSYSEETGIFLIEISDDAFFDSDKFLRPNQDVLEITFKVKSLKEDEKILINSIKLVNADYSTVEQESVEAIAKKNSSILKIIVPIVFGIIVFILLIIIRKVGGINEKIQKRYNSVNGNCNDFNTNKYF